MEIRVRRAGEIDDWDIGAVVDGIFAGADFDRKEVEMVWKLINTDCDVRCPICGQSYPIGGTHACPTGMSGYTNVNYQPNAYCWLDPVTQQLLDSMVSILEKMVEVLEKIEEKL